MENLCGQRAGSRNDDCQACADEDAAVVERLRAAGAIVMGKTNTPEFAFGPNTVNAVFGATRNPWNPALSSGGSSGGSAAALATGMCPIAQGTDLGGSLRGPAALCGVVGFRTTPGLIPRYPEILAAHRASSTPSWRSRGPNSEKSPSEEPAPRTSATTSMYPRSTRYG